MPPYVFRPMLEADMPLVQRWLIEPHVAEWWHDPATLEYVSGDLDHPDLAQFIVSCKAGRSPICSATRSANGTTVLDRNLRARAGSTSSLARPICSGAAMARPSYAPSSTGSLRAGVPRIVIDPRPDNPRAIRAYEKAGFVPQHEIVTPDGPALLMIRNP